jgi:fructan beta-fructosidase
MSRSFLVVLAAAVATTLGVPAAAVPTVNTTETTQWRPTYHYTPAANFMNDPNGLIQYKGVYHLFYQHNPSGDTAGNGSWGHATSTDLVHWTEHPIAIAADANEEVWSGSVVLDKVNASGFGSATNPPLVAIYTSRDNETGLQRQALAFSLDAGETWTKYAGNPVLDIGSHDFRDPKVSWNEKTRRWVMVVAKSVERKVGIYSSADLKTWRHESDFGPAGATGGVWECPDLFALPYKDAAGVTTKKWVLTLSVSGKVQYFVGDFDGATFTSPDASYTPPAGKVINDFEGDAWDAGWTTTGTAFGNGPDTPPADVFGAMGSRYVDSYGDGDFETGTLSSPDFQIDKPYLNLLVGGGSYPHVEGGSKAPPEGDLFADFEADGLQAGWTGTGSFTDLTNTTWSDLPGRVGRGVLDTCWAGCDPAVGTVRSPDFTISRDFINLLVAGGNHPLSGPEPTAVSLVVDGQVVKSETGDNSPNMNWRAWDVKALQGKTAHIEVTDRRTADWGHIMLDHIVFSDAAAAPWSQETTANLVVDGQVVRSATGANSPSLDWTSWDVAELQGRTGHLEFIDDATGGWGHIYADQAMLADAPALDSVTRTRWIDHGADYYAAVTFNDLPGDRRVQIGWLGSWDYANSTPTAPWRGAQSISRELTLADVGGRPTLVQKPVVELNRSLGKATTQTLKGLTGSRTLGLRGTALDLDVTLTPHGTSDTGVVVRKGDAEGTRIGWSDGQLYVDRTASGEDSFSPAFARTQRVAVPLVDGQLRLRILVDRSSVEVFTRDGRVAVTDLIFPDLSSDGIAAYAVGGTVDAKVVARPVN